MTTRPHLALVAADSAPASPVPATRAITFPDGVTMPLEARGVYRARCLVGDACEVYAVDSAGDSRGMRTLVPMTATATEYRAAVLDLWARLDACDPVPGPRLVDGGALAAVMRGAPDLPPEPASR